MANFELPDPTDDGYAIPVVGPWSRDKHHFLRRYLHAFTGSMKHKPWDGMHYIDLFAGAGIERIEEGGRCLGLDWGSPLLAAQVPAKFTRMHLVEKDPVKFRALCARMGRFPQPTAPQLLNEDANRVATAIVADIPPGALCLAFLDPYGLHLDYATLRILAQRRVDLIIFFPDHLDALRNFEINYADDSNSNLDRVLGGAPWREAKKQTPADGWAEMLRKLYVQQIQRLGYQEFEFERICMSNGSPLYKLIFCSRNETGSRIWRKVSMQKPDGQRAFDFEG